MLRLEHVSIDISIDSADKCENAPACFRNFLTQKTATFQLEKLSLEHVRNFDGLLAQLSRVLGADSKLKQISVAHSAGEMDELK